MSTRLHRFVPRDVRHVPTPAKAAVGLAWLRTEIAADKIEAEAPGHITFFDCGGGLDKIFCPSCQTEVDAELWKDWMDAAWTEGAGFTLTSRVLACCSTAISLEALGSAPLCVFGSFALVITDPMTTPSDAELRVMLHKLEAMLGCPLHRVDAHY
jgi:hypothetical protein